jgi:hypothetical protein
LVQRADGQLHDGDPAPRQGGRAPVVVEVEPFLNGYLDELAYDIGAADRFLRYMSPHHHFIRTLQDIPVASSVTVNSIIAIETDGPVEQGNDGVVEYSSAHIEPVESEFIVRPSSHSTQGNPHTIEEVRRILRLHVDRKTGTVPLRPLEPR